MRMTPQMTRRVSLSKMADILQDVRALSEMTPQMTRKSRPGRMLEEKYNPSGRRPIA